MKKQLASAAVALCFVFGVGAAAAQEKVHTETTTKHTGPGPDSKMKAESVTGTVKEYEAGKKIKISGPGDKTYSFDLDNGAQVQGTVVVGQMAKVTYHKMNDGIEHVSVVSDASHGAQMDAAAPKMKTETTMKHTGPGPNTKMTTKTVVGTVKEYEAGKKITVTGPHNKDYSFDLDENAGVTGAIAVGERVKVTYTKGDHGHKVTTVKPYRAKM